MAINRVDFGGDTLIDLTGDTLESAEQLLKGIIAHARDGSVITGLMEAGGGSGGGGFDSNHVDIAYGSFVTAKAVRGVRVDCGFPISKDDAFMYVFGCIPIATRTRGANITGYFANKMPSASLPDTAYGGTFYSSITSTRLSPSGVVNLDNVFIDTTGNDIRIIGYGSWEFVPTNEYFWIVVKEKNA